MSKRSWAVLAMVVVSAAVAVSCQLQDGPAASTGPATAAVARGGTGGGAAPVSAGVTPATVAAAPVTPPASVSTAPLATGAKANALDKWVPIHNDFYWVDDKGARIQTRSGCLDKFGDTFYWYGGNNGFRQQMCYASTDLIHWVNKGVVLQHIVDANRIDVLYNEKTKKYVMFLKYDTNGAFLGIATADKPEGPFSFQKPPVTDAQMVAMSTQDLKDAGPFYLVDGARMGDMSAWMDDDGKAYIAYVSWAVGTNAQHGIYQMTDDFTGLEKRIYLWNIRSREAPHIFKRNDIYYYGTSRTAGIQSSGTAYYTAKELGGPWSPAKPLDMGASQNSWDSQVDFVYPFKGTQGELYMFAGDRWTKNVPAGRNGDYIWLPMEWKGDVPTVNYYQDWELNVALGTWRKFDPARDLALGKKATASSENGANVAANVTRATTYDNYIDTVWESAAGDPQWVQVDLGAAMDVNRVILKWGTEYAAAFKIQTSLDGIAWTDVYSTTTGGQGGYTVTDETFKTTSARYVRMLASSRGVPARGGRGGGGGRGGAAGGGAGAGAGRGAAGGAPGVGRGGPTPAGAALSSGGYSLFAFEVLKD